MAGTYDLALREFVAWNCSEPRFAFNRAVAAVRIIDGTAFRAISKGGPRVTCARLCHPVGGELDETQFVLGHVSIQTTERYGTLPRQADRGFMDSGGIETRGK